MEVFIGAGIALIGSAIALISVFATVAFNLYRESLHKKWEKEIFQRERKVQIIERRCEQIEIFMVAIIEDFRLLERDVEFFSVISQNQEVTDRKIAIEERNENMDFRIFALSPAIRALRNEDISDMFQLLFDYHEKLQKFVKHVYEERFERNKKVDVEETRNEIDELWSKFRKQAGDIYGKLDELRIEIL